MGQYYVPVLIGEDESIRTLYSHDYDNGLKLMEHSYIGNNFVNAVLTELWKKPARVAWIGDYSDAYQGDRYEEKLSHDAFMRYYHAAWKDRDKHRVRPAPSVIIDMGSTERYLINHTQRSYIDIADYIALNTLTEKGAWRNGAYDPNATYEMCVHPLPLLTACGNNRGGGDYYHPRPDHALAGSWAFDRIECSDAFPDGYTPAMFYFTGKTTEKQKAG